MTDHTEELARVIAECGFLPDHQATDIARAILTSPVIAEIEREAERRVVEWLRSNASIKHRHGPAITRDAFMRDIADAIGAGEHRRVT